MSAPDTATHRFLCTVCGAKGITSVVEVLLEQEHVRCSQCHSLFEVATRPVVLYKPHSIDIKTTRYQFHTAEPNKRTKPRTFVAQAGLKFKVNTLVTFVWHRHQLVGIADQTNNIWHPLQLVPTGSPLINKAAKILLVFVGLLSVTYVWRWLTQIADYATQSTTSVLVLLVGLLLAVSPLLVWALRVGYGSSLRKQSSFPMFRDGFDFDRK